MSRSSNPFQDLTNRLSMATARINEFSNLSMDSHHSFLPTSPDYRQVTFSHMTATSILPLIILIVVFQSLLQNTISCSVINANDRSPIDTDSDEDSFSMADFDVFPFDPRFPSTSTERNSRAIPVCHHT